jgi:TRAP-type mannitol/chloroaromatic compound transport system permease small subunit
MNALLAFSRFVDTLNRRIGQAIIWLVLLAVVISTLNALARKFLNIGSNAFLEIQWYLFAAVFLLGGAPAFLQNAHVRIDVLANRLTPKNRTLIDLFGIVFFLLPLCGFMIYYAWPIVQQAYLSGEVSSNAGGLIRWPAYALVPLGFSLLGLQAISEFIKRIAFLQGRAENPLLGHGHGAKPPLPSVALTSLDKPTQKEGTHP